MLVTTITLTDFVPYARTEHLKLQAKDFEVSAEHRPMLEGAMQLGLKLEYDLCMMPGLDIKDRRGNTVATVSVGMNDNWLQEVLHDLQELVDNPQKYGIL